MAKIKVSADMVLSILQGIMNTDEINYEITDKSAPLDWQGKKVQEALGIEYYTFRHRPVDTEIIVRELINQGKQSNSLESLKRSFCILALNSTERVFSKKNDIVKVLVNLEYWIQSEKVKLLEDMFEDIAVETIGERISVQIGKESRQALIALGSLNIAELQETSEYGEMAICDIDIEIVLYPNVFSLADYNIEFLTTGLANSEGVWTDVPISGLSIVNTMNQKSVPYVNNVRNVGSINLSRVKAFVFTFDGYKNNAFIEFLSKNSLSGDFYSEGSLINESNNSSVILRITRENEVFVYDCVIKEHLVKVQEDTGNETHSLTLTTRGIKNGIA